MAMYERFTVRPTILACKDTRLHLPEGLVPLVRRVPTWLPKVPLRRREHQRLEYGLRDGNSLGLGRDDLRGTIRSRDAGWKTTSEEAHTGSRRREK